MKSKSGLVRRRMVAISVISTVVLVGSLLAAITFGASAFADDTNGGPQTFKQVSCTAHLNGGTITQKQDITVNAFAPNSVAPGADIAITFPTSSATLPASSNGLTITAYKNLLTKYVVNGAPVVAGSGTVDGPATINGDPTPATVDTVGSNLQPTVPGPIPPGTLVTPNGAGHATAGADGSTVTVSATEVDTTATVTNFGDVPVTCPVPANTLTTTHVGSGTPPTTAGGGPTTTVGGGATTTTLPQSTDNTVTCTITGALTLKPGVHTTGAVATKGTSESIKVKATMPSCSGGPPGLKAPITHGAFKLSGSIKTAAGQAVPSCTSLKQGTAQLKPSAIKLQSATNKSVASLKSSTTLSPLDTGGANVSFMLTGIVSSRGVFNAKSTTGVFNTTLTPAEFANACAASGVTTLNFDTRSRLYVGPAPVPPPPPTTTTTAAPTTTLAPATTTILATTTTVSSNPVPPAVVAAIGQACTTLAGAVGPLGVDITPLYFACVQVANGQGPELFTLFLASPQLGCVFLAGVPLATNPQVAAACIQFATAIQPYSSLIGSLLPPLP